MTPRWTDPITKDHERKCVDWASARAAQLGFTVEYDAANKTWDIETPTGWHSAKTGFEFAQIVLAESL